MSSPTTASASTLLVNVAEDAEVRLVHLLAGHLGAERGDAFAADCQACIDSGNAEQLCQTMIAGGAAAPVTTLLSTEISTDEAASALALLAALLERTGPEAGAALAEQLTDTIVQYSAASASPQETTERKLALLSVLYNMRSNVSEKCRLLGCMLRLAAASDDAAAFLAPSSLLGRLLCQDNDGDNGDNGESTSDVAAAESTAAGSATTSGTASCNILQSGAGTVPQHPRLVTLMDSWGVSKAERQELLYTAAKSLPAKDVRKQRFWLFLVETFVDGQSLPPNAAEAAREAAVGAIRDPITLFAQQRNLLQNPAIQALDKEAATQDLLGLLRVFQQGKLSDYKAYCASSGGEAALLAKYGLNADQCLRHMRILSLCSLASEQEEIPYATIAETLQLEDKGMVESWVIAAVSSGLVQAKMDQLTQTVLVERSVVRKFDMEQWKILQGRLSSWKQNVGSILETLKQSQTVAATAGTTTT